MLVFRIEDVKVNNRKTLAIGNLIVNGKIFKGASGGWGNGALPCGLYDVQKSVKLPDIKENEAYKRTEFPWYARLTPLFRTERTGLLIHPDGNILGSLGCIAISENDSELFKMLTNLSGKCTLKVI